VIFERYYKNKISNAKIAHFKEGLTKLISLRCSDKQSVEGGDENGTRTLVSDSSTPNIPVCCVCGSVSLSGYCDCHIYSQVEEEREGARTIEMSRDGQGNYREWGPVGSAVPFNSHFGSGRVENSPQTNIPLSSPLQVVLDLSNPIFFYSNQNVVELHSRPCLPKFVKK
jgi:hypothetical protein